MRKALNLLKIKNIDILVYGMSAMPFNKPQPINYTIETEAVDANKNRYFIINDNKLVHSSILFNKIHILKLLNKTGPAIGDCVTIPEYRGKSIYPFVIHHIACETLKHKPEVFIIVNSNNINSIRGIEKAGFRLYAKIKTKRFLSFYYQTKVTLA